MGNIFNEDFSDFLNALNKYQVKYILVGGFSVILHGYSRTTGDMDIWVERTINNYKKIVDAFTDFGMPVFDMTEDNFLNHPVWDVYTFGRPPAAIDIMMAVKGLSFEEAYERALIMQQDGVNIKVIHKNDLLNAKKSSGRPKDMDDIINLSD